MGLDVGVVRITYLERPKEPTYSFLQDLPADGMDEHWGGGWPGNTIVEFEREQLTQEATDWAMRRNLGANERTGLQSWIDNLPWDGDTIMLHLNW
jgi:hypothetical protein